MMGKANPHPAGSPGNPDTIDPEDREEVVGNMLALAVDAAARWEHQGHNPDLIGATVMKLIADVGALLTAYVASDTSNPEEFCRAAVPEIARQILEANGVQS